MNRTIPMLSLALLGAACSSTPSAVEVTRRGPGAVVGSWSSEADGSTLAFARDGTFRLDRGTVAITGRWRVEGDAIVIEHDEPSPACTGEEGSYRPEIVRDTLRLVLLRDECLWREELMAWPWTRP